MIRFGTLLLLPLLVTACNRPGVGPQDSRYAGGLWAGSPPTVTAPSGPNHNNAIRDACRQAADRVLEVRDRGELMREDELDGRSGVRSNSTTQMVEENNKLGRLFQRDNMASECVQYNLQTAPDQQRTAPAIRFNPQGSNPQ